MIFCASVLLVVGTALGKEFFHSCGENCRNNMPKKKQFLDATFYTAIGYMVLFAIYVGFRNI